MRSMIVGGALDIGAGLTAADTKEDIVDLTAGSLTFSRSDTDELVVHAAEGDVFDSAFGPSTRLQIIQGLGSGEHILSPIINPHTLTISKQLGVSAAAKVVAFGRTTDNSTVANWLLTLEPGIYARIRVVDVSANTHITGSVNTQFTVDHLITATDTAGTVHASLLAKLQTKAGKFYASVADSKDSTDYGFVFTGKVGLNFKVIGEEALHGTAITIETAYNPGKGLGSVLAIDERNFATHRGYNNTYHMQNDLFSPDRLFINTATLYTVYTLKWTNPHKSALAAGDDPFEVECQICVPASSTATTITQLDAVISAIADQSVEFAA